MVTGDLEWVPGPGHRLTLSPGTWDWPSPAHPKAGWVLVPTHHGDVHPPGFEPMLARASRQLEGGGWAFEPKLDGSPHSSGVCQRVHDGIVVSDRVSVSLVR